jgi:hypothetical protein
VRLDRPLASHRHLRETAASTLQRCIHCIANTPTNTLIFTSNHLPTHNLWPAQSAEQPIHVESFLGLLQQFHPLSLTKTG